MKQSEAQMILNGLRVLQHNTPFHPDIYMQAFNRVEAASVQLNPLTAETDGQIALMGLRWRGFRPIDFGRLSSERAILFTQLPEIKEAEYQNGHKYLLAVAEILPAIQVLSDQFRTIVPLDHIHTVLNRIIRTGQPQGQIPLSFIKAVRAK